MPPFFSFVLCFLRQKIINNFNTFCDVYAAVFVLVTIDVTTALRQIRLIARLRNGRCRAECGNVEGSEWRCKRPSGVRGGARSKKYVSKMTHEFFITINSMILYLKHIIHIDDFPLNGQPPSIYITIGEMSSTFGRFSSCAVATRQRSWRRFLRFIVLLFYEKIIMWHFATTPCLCCATDGSA